MIRSICRPLQCPLQRFFVSYKPHPPVAASYHHRIGKQDTKAVSVVYVHPLSQLVLRHLQTHCHDWICKNGLDRGLVLRRDGTFQLTSNGLSIWTLYEDRQHWLVASLGRDDEQRFLLQDNTTMSTWKSGYNRTDLIERIKDSVQELMDTTKEDTS